MSSNVESLLSAILTGDEKYIVVPQSRVEELLLAIYKNGGGGGGGGTAGIKYLGVIDNYKNLSTTAKKGDYYLAGTADKDKNVHVGDMLIAQKDNPSATIDNSNYRLLHTELDTDTTYTITQDSKDAHIFYFKASTETGTGTKITIPDNDTKTTAASDEKAATKLYLVGTMTQDANGVKTYANAKVYIGTDDCLYSNGKKVAIQEDVDNKVNKTSVSYSKEGGETTSVINVTDAKAQMAMVAKISGKTIKSPNLFDKNNVVKNKGYNGSGVEGDTKDWNDHSEFIPVKPNTKYYIANVQGSNVYYAANEFNASKTWIRLNPISGNSDASGVITTSSTTAYIVVNVAPSMASKTIVAESASAVPYSPYGLLSAPVESVVSRGRNLCSPFIYGIQINPTSGSEVAYATACSTDFIPVKPSTSYYINNVAATLFSFVTWYDSAKNKIDRTGAGAVSYHSISLPANAKYVRITVYENPSVSGKISAMYDREVMMNEGTSALPYTPYNKTTVLVPSAVKNLPDYGCSVGDIANEIDFENGVYYHRVIKKKVKEFTWNYSTGQETFGTTLNGLKTLPSNTTVGQIMSGRYTPLDYYKIYWNKTNALGYDKVIGYFGTTLTIIDSSVKTNGADFVAKYGEEEMVFILETPEVKPLSDYLRPLPVENGGTLTLVNEHSLDVNSTIKYKKEV